MMRAALTRDCQSCFIHHAVESDSVFTSEKWGSHPSTKEKAGTPRYSMTKGLVTSWILLIHELDSNQHLLHSANYLLFDS